MCLSFSRTLLSGRSYLALCAWFGLLLINQPSLSRPADNSPPAGHITAKLPANAARTLLKRGQIAAPKPLKNQRIGTVADPIRFSISSDNVTVRAGEPVELTLKAELLDIPPSIMFFLDEAYTFRLKMVIPAGFVVTGGTYTDLAGDRLSLHTNPVVTYKLRGYFESITGGTCFRLLRGNATADNNSLFVEKAKFCMSVSAEADNGITGTGVRPLVTQSQNRGESANQVQGSADQPVFQASTGLAFTTPNYEPTTGLLTLNTAGGNGTLIEFACLGVTSYSSSRTVTIPAWQRDGSVSFTIKARQSGQEQATLVFTPNAPATAPAPTTPTGQALAFATPSYDAATGLLTLNTTGGDGTLIEFACLGVTGYSSSRTVTIPAWQRDGSVSFTIKARQSGQERATLVFTPNGSTTAPTTPTTTPTTPTTPTGQALAFATPSYDAATGLLTLNTTGGDGTLIEFACLGVTGYSSSRTVTIPAWQRDGSVSFTIKARQSGQERATLVFTPNATATAPTTPTPAPTTPTGQALAFATPSYDAATGLLTLNTTGGDGTLIEFACLGVTGYSSSRTVTIPAWQRDGSVSFTIKARQSGQERATLVFTPNATATAPTTPTPAPTTPTGQALAFATPSYDAATGLLTLNTTGGDGTLIEFACLGVTSYSSSRTVTIPAWQRDGSVSFTIKARQSGQERATLVFTPNGTASSPGSPCSGISLQAGASPASLLVNTQTILSATCAGCGDAGGYKWTALQGGSSLQNPNGANTAVTVPGNEGTYTYRVTLTRGSCVTTKDVTLTVTNTSSPTNSAYLDMGRAGTLSAEFNIGKSSAQNGKVAVSDLSGYSVGGYNTYYFINDVYVGTSLTNYPLPVNAKYAIDKLITRATISPGYGRLADLNRASGESGFIQGWRQQIIDTYDPGTPFAGDQIIAGGRGTLLPTYQSWFVRSNNWNMVAAKDAPAMSLPATKMFGGVIIENKPTLADYQSRGWNAFELASVGGQPVSYSQRSSLPSGGELNGALNASPSPIRSVLMNNHSQESYDQGRLMAEYIDVSRSQWVFDQFGETHFGFYNSSGYLGYYERLRELNPTSRVFASYGQLAVRYQANRNFQTLGGGQRNPLDVNSFRYLYSSQQNARTRHIVSDQGILTEQPDPFYASLYNGKSLASIGVSQLIQLYVYDNSEIDLAYVKMHEMDVMLKQDPDRRPIGFFWPLRESPGGATAGNSAAWEHETTNPAGRVRQTSHTVCGMTLPEAFAFDMMVRGNGLYLWHNTPKVGNDRNIIATTPDYPSQYFDRNGNASSGFPFVDYTYHGAAPFSPLAGFDAAHQGRDKAIRALNWLETPTPQWQYASYTVDGIRRQAPADGSAILMHAADYKPMVMILSNPNTGRKVVWAFDPYAEPNRTQSLAVEVGDARLDMTLVGNAVHVVLFN